MSDTFPPGPENRRPARKEEQPAGVSLPEILILSDDISMVDIIRGAIEDRGYRIRHFPSHVELQVRLKVAGRVVIIVDGRIDGAGSFLRDIATSDYPDRIVILPDIEHKGLFEGIPDLILHSLPISTEGLLSIIEDLSNAPITRPGTGKSNLFSSLTKPEPDKTPGDQVPVDEETVSSASDPDTASEPAPVEDISEPLDDALFRDPTIADMPLESAPAVTPAPVQVYPPAPEIGEPVSEGTGASSPEGPPRMADMVSAQPEIPAGVIRPNIPAASAAPSTDSEILSTGGDVCSDIVSLYGDAVAITLQFLRGHRGRSEPPISGIAQIVEQLIASVTNASDLCLKVIQHTTDFDDADHYLAYHQVNVALLAMRAGMGLKMSSEKLYELTLGAMVHDIGMTQLPEGLITRQGKLDQSGYAQIKQHPAYGKQLLASYAGAYPFLQTMAYQEHERLDGSGYPEGLSGTSIHVYARVIGLVDTYEALTHVRPFRDHMIPFNVLQQLIRLGGQLFDKDIVKAFIDEISVFPAGSYVRLNSGEICNVVTVNIGFPLRPVTQVLYTADGSVLEQGRIIDLKNEPMIYITGPEDPRDFPQE
ncbi:HD domain-containing phosphohydrolase [Candidatus Zixiibacteriota bacterium]